MENKLVALVPARLGSKRVTGKSLRLLNKKPLISYCIDALKETAYFSDICINSDSELYEQVALRESVKFYKRRPELATSESLIDDYIYDFVLHTDADYLAIVNPTSPFVTSDEYDRAWEQYRNGDCDTLLSCERIQTHCFYQGIPVNFDRDGQHPRSQDLEPLLALNFAITIINCEKYRQNYEKHQWGLYTGTLGFFETTGIGSIDIDYEEDFQLAEFMSQFMEAQSSNEFSKEYDPIIQPLIDSGRDISN